MAEFGRDRSEALRLRLASVGIVLEDPKPAAGEGLPRAHADPAADPPVNRAAIRAILRANGADERDLEWLVASCPSKQAARDYRPPPVILAPGPDPEPDETT